MCFGYWDWAGRVGGWAAPDFVGCGCCGVCAGAAGSVLQVNCTCFIRPLRSFAKGLPLGLAADAGLPVFLGACGAAGLARDGPVGAVFTEAEFPVSPPFFLGAEASVLHALRALASLLFVGQPLLPICLVLGWFWFRGALRWSDPWCGLLGRFADLGFWREISDWGFPGLPGVRCLPWRQLEGISRNLWFCIGHADGPGGLLALRRSSGSPTHAPWRCGWGPGHRRPASGAGS